MVVDVLEMKEAAVGLLFCFFSSAAVAIIMAALAVALAAVVTMNVDVDPSSGSSFFCAAAETASNQPVSWYSWESNRIPGGFFPWAAVPLAAALLFRNCALYINFPAAARHGITPGIH